MAQMLEASEVSLLPAYHYKPITKSVVVPGLLMSPSEKCVFIYYVKTVKLRMRAVSERPDVYESLNSKLDLANY